MKIAFDENVPVALVRVLQTLANERQLKGLMGNVQIESAADYTPKPGDPDYVKKNDVPWIKRFAAAGGKVIISGDINMKSVPHERLALIQAGMVDIFFESSWSNWPFFRKCALLIHWWPKIAARIKKAKPPLFLHVPLNFNDKGTLRKVSTEDPRKLKIEKQKKAQGKIRRQREEKKKQAAVVERKLVQGSLLDLMDAQAPTAKG